jgi:hypothetical protein
MFKLSILQENKWEVGQTLEATLLTPSNIPPLGYGQIYRPLSKLPKNYKQYEVTINDYSIYSCVDFSSMMSGSFGKWGPWVPCNYTYITFYNLPCMLGLENHSCNIHLGIGMRFINY